MKRGGTGREIPTGGVVQRQEGCASPSAETVAAPVSTLYHGCMNHSHTDDRPRFPLPHIPLPSLDLLRFLLDLYRSLHAWLAARRPAGLYEILDYESRLELCDPAGAVAVLTKRQRVKFLQDHVIAFEDYAWGDGENFETRANRGQGYSHD